MTRILHVTECYEAGVGRAVNSIVSSLPDHEHHLLWEGADPPSSDATFASTARLSKNPFVARRRIVMAVARVKPDVVHAHSSWAGVFTRIRNLRAPVIYQPHCYKFDDPASSQLFRRAYRLVESGLAKRTSAVVVLSPHEERLATELAPSTPRHFVPNAPSVLPREAAERTGYHTGDTVMMSGRAAPQKDPAFFADVARLVRTARPDTRFVWIGDGPLRSVLEDAGVEVTGWVDSSALASHLAQPALYFHSAMYEGFPLSILDAVAFEHPVVTRALPAFEGMPIPMAQSAADAATLVIDALAGGPALDHATAAATHLHENLNETAQHAALEDLYATF